jgi:uncharacterized protein YybS (DUF2232 family)
VKGLKTGLKPVLWSGAAFLMLIMFAVPVLNLIALLFMMVPYAYLYATLSKRAFVLHLLPAWILASVVVGPSILIIGFFFLVPGIIMGHLYRKGTSAGKVIRLTSLVILAQLMLELLAFEVFLDLSLLEEMKMTIRGLLDGLMAQSLAAAGWGTEQTELLIQTVINWIPLTFIVMAFTYSVLSHYVARKFVARDGVDAPAFPEAKDWKLPRVLVIYYLIAYVINLFMSSASDSFMAIALMNLVPLLSYVFAIQAIGFFFFIAHHRGWNKAVPILIAIPVLLIPPLSLIGVFDTAFPIRKSFTKQQ